MSIVGVAADDSAGAFVQGCGEELLEEAGAEDDGVPAPLPVDRDDDVLAACMEAIDQGADERHVDDRMVHKADDRAIDRAVVQGA